MICFPNCKINLGLSITEKRTDGFHNLETIMYPLKLNDVLEIIASPDNHFEFHSTGIPINGEQSNNLIVKTYQLLKSEYQLPPVKIHLHKIIPIGAGLGGGSSDAAFAIKTLNDLFNLELSISKMQNYARKLGADCAFFIENKSVWATNKGDHFDHIHINLNNYFFVVIQPKIHINTAEAYSWVKPKVREKSIQEIIKGPIENWEFDLKNDFEAEVFSRFPEIKEIKDKLYKSGAIYASMSGSGSAVYGIFKKPTSVENIFKDYYCWTGRGL